MTGYIVGKGPSLRKLTADYFGQGLVFAINESIRKVEELDLSNKIYSVQKDGASPEYRLDCPLKQCHECIWAMVYPKKATLLLHEHESKECMPDYPDRKVFDNELMGLNWFDQSAQSCIKLATVMGCTNLILLCFDSVTSGSTKSVYNNTLIDGERHDELERPEYEKAIEALKAQLNGIAHQFIEPK